MNTRERILMIRLSEKVRRYPAYARSVGIEVKLHARQKTKPRTADGRP